MLRIVAEVAVALLFSLLDTKHVAADPFGAQTADTQCHLNARYVRYTCLFSCSSGAVRIQIFAYFKIRKVSLSKYDKGGIDTAVG